MKIILDNNVPVGIVRLLPDHEVTTSPELEWERLKNGALLDAAQAAGFDVLITADQNMQYQQNLSARTVSLIVLGSNIWPIVKAYAPTIISSVIAANLGSFVFIEMPLPPKPKRQGG